MVSLFDRIKNRSIKFYNGNKELEIPTEFGNNNSDLIESLVSESGRYISVRGEKLEETLYNKDHIFDLAKLLVTLHSKNKSFKFHVDVDIGNINKGLNYPNSVHFENMKQSFVPYLSDFEFCWNFALDLSIRGNGSYIGYKPPKDKKEWDHTVIDSLRVCLIGKKNQLNRYRSYGNEKINNLIDYFSK